MSRKNYVFTSESVSEGHPDKLCDRVSDAVLDAFLTEEAHARVACETFATTGRVVVGGEVGLSDKKALKAMKERVDRLEVARANMVDWIGAREEAGMDRFVLLDAQDWMNNAQLDDLWAKITRASRPGARVLFRTAAEPSLLPGRLDDAILSKWRYLEETSTDCTRRDRSSIYGGVHVYELV